MGLDLHERVSVEPERAEQGMRSRQLFVLAGDYFSSLFYRFLAERGEIRTISRLSEAVCEVNEAKMELYALADSRQVSPPTYLGLIRPSGGVCPPPCPIFFMLERDRTTRGGNSAQDLTALEWLADADVEYPGASSVIHTGEMRLELIRTILAGVRREAAGIAHPEVRRELLRVISERFDPYLTEPLAREG